MFLDKNESPYMGCCSAENVSLRRTVGAWSCGGPRDCRRVPEPRMAGFSVGFRFTRLWVWDAVQKIAKIACSLNSIFFL